VESEESEKIKTSDKDSSILSPALEGVKGVFTKITTTFSKDGSSAETEVSSKTEILDESQENVSTAVSSETTAIDVKYEIETSVKEDALFSSGEKDEEPASNRGSFMTPVIKGAKNVASKISTPFVKSPSPGVDESALSIETAASDDMTVDNTAVVCATEVVVESEESEKTMTSDKDSSILSPAFDGVKGVFTKITTTFTKDESVDVIKADDSANTETLLGSQDNISGEIVVESSSLDIDDRQKEQKEQYDIPATNKDTENVDKDVSFMTPVIKGAKGVVSKISTPFTKSLSSRDEDSDVTTANVDSASEITNTDEASIEMSLGAENAISVDNSKTSEFEALSTSGEETSILSPAIDGVKNAFSKIRTPFVKASKDDEVNVDVNVDAHVDTNVTIETTTTVDASLDEPTNSEHVVGSSVVEKSWTTTIVEGSKTLLTKVKSVTESKEEKEDIPVEKTVIEKSEDTAKQIINFESATVTVSADENGHNDSGVEL